MGYSTTFKGSIQVEPPLSPEEIKFLQGFARTRRTQRKEGPYYVAPEQSKTVSFDQSVGQDYGNPNVTDMNNPPLGQPGLWCQWEPTDDGKAIEWNGSEKFYDSLEWMQYLMDHFIGPKPIASQLPAFKFLKPHKCNGEIAAQGDDPSDQWKLVVKNGKCKRLRGVVHYEE